MKIAAVALIAYLATPSVNAESLRVRRHWFGTRATNDVVGLV